MVDLQGSAVGPGWEQYPSRSSAINFASTSKTLMGFCSSRRKWQRLYFNPDLHQHGSLRPIFSTGLIGSAFIGGAVSEGCGAIFTNIIMGNNQVDLGGRPKPDIRGETPEEPGKAARLASGGASMHKRKPHSFWLAKNCFAFFRISLSSLRVRFSCRRRSLGPDPFE
jgi:hypothetical protein